jgi:hypothetical protein
MYPTYSLERKSRGFERVCRCDIQIRNNFQWIRLAPERNERKALIIANRSKRLKRVVPAYKHPRPFLVTASPLLSLSIILRQEPPVRSNLSISPRFPQIPATRRALKRLVSIVHLSDVEVFEM